MCEQQPDLFSSAGIEANRPLPLSNLAPGDVLDDQALIAAIPDSVLADSTALAARGRQAAAAPTDRTLQILMVWLWEPRVDR
jgi:hypothetical protein